LGEYPGDPGPPGGDCSGTVAAVAESGIMRLNVGDSAFGFCDGSLASIARGATTHLVPLPVGMSFEHASTLPITWSTAHVAIAAARCRSLHRTLVHAVAGGVGLVATEYFAWLNLTTLGTVGQPYKHAALHSEGISVLCCSSRSAGAFTAGLARGMKRARLHSVLNSLSADFTTASFASLGENGCFNEIGKRGVWSLEKASGVPTVDYNLIAVDMDMLQRADWMFGMLRLLASRGSKDIVHGLPIATFDFARSVQQAFRFLQKGQNVGKVVVRIAHNAGVKCENETQVLTGGTGGLGLITAGWLVEAGPTRHIVLVSRSGAISSGALESVRTRGSSKVVVEQCDAAEPTETRKLTATLQRSLPPLRGVWHTAGVLADALLAQQDASGLQRSYGAKVGGAVNLQCAHAGVLLESCVLFSSVAGLVGGAGQANYAAANTVLDALAASRKSRGGNGASVSWGPWAEAGMAAGGAISSRMSAMGLGLIDPWQGLAAMQAAVDASRPSMVAFWLVRWEVMLGRGKQVPPLLQALAPRSTPPPRAAKAAKAAPAREPVATISLDAVLEMVQRQAGDTVNADAPLMEAGLDSLGAVELRNTLQQTVGEGAELPSTLIFDHPTTRSLASVLTSCTKVEALEEAPTSVLQEVQVSANVGLDAILDMVHGTAGGDIDADTPLMDAGLDSLGAVELRNQLQQAAGEDFELPSTLIFDHPTARSLAVVLQPAGAAAPVQMGTPTMTGCTASAQSPAIGGSSYSLPDGMTTNAGGIDVVGEVPAERWDVNAQPPLADSAALSRTRHGSFMRRIELLDNGAFNIGAVEAAATDPQQRLLLENGYMALHRAKVDMAGLNGIFLGIAAADYARVLTTLPAGDTAYGATGGALSIAAGRLSYVLGMHGPCVSYDTACASALAACHAGLRSVQLAECVSSLVSGVTVMLVPTVGRSFAIAGMTSVQGKSYTFDTRADGYARGETCGNVVLCDASNPAALGVQGSSVRQDGRSASLTAPNGSAQQGLLKAAMADAGTTAEVYALAEAHGTGTGLGDPIEAGSLAGALLSGRTAAPLALGGIKANMGHAEPAAGMSGLLGLALGLRSSVAAPNAQLRVLNLHMAPTLRNALCGLSLQPAKISPAEQAVGGVSSFGFSGTIVHTVLHTASDATRTTTVPLARVYKRRIFPIYDGAVAPGSAAPSTKLSADSPLLQAGVTSVAAVKLASRLQVDTGINLSATLVFEHPTPRAIATYLATNANDGVPTSLCTPESVLSLLEELIAAHPPQAVPTAEAAPGKSDSASVTPNLVRLSAPASGSLLFGIPNGTGNAQAYGALVSVVPNTIYAVMHPHLSADLRQRNEGLDATQLEQIIDDWTMSILHECTRTSAAAFVLMGASIGGLFANMVGLSADRQGRPAQGIVLIDPAPPIRPLSHVRAPGMRGAAAYLALHGIGLDLAFLEDADDADLGVKLASRRAELGLAPFTERSVLEQQRELRASTHLLGLAAAYQSQADAQNYPKLAKLLSRVTTATPTTLSSASPVWLVLAAAREEFFVNSAGLTKEEASSNTARLYGSIADELTVPGDHLDVCSRCMIGDVEAFKRMLERALHLP